MAPITISIESHNYEGYFLSSTSGRREGKHLLADTLLAIGRLHRVDWDNVSLSTKAVVGGHLQKNFEMEGAFMGKGWQNLSDYTAKVRMDRGYYGHHPILVQSGQLRDAVLLPFNPMVGARGTSGAGVRSVLTSGKGELNFTVSGEKVQNQFGGFILNGGMAAIGSTGKVGRYGKGFLPARPFLYVSQAMADDIATNVVRNLNGMAFQSFGAEGASQVTKMSYAIPRGRS